MKYKKIYILNSDKKQPRKKDKLKLKKKKKKLLVIISVLIIIIVIQLIINLIIIRKKSKSFNEINNNEKMEDIDTNIILSIHDKLNGIIECTLDEEKYLNGIIRKFRPKKIVEIGVSAGGTSAVILNAIKDIPDAKLYSIDRKKNWYKGPSKKVGWLVEEKFSELMNKWTLYTDINTAEVIEKIGNNIEFAFIDTVHTCPGEMLNWLEVLPFLKEEAIVVFHDIYLMYYDKFAFVKKKRNFTNNQLYVYIRGQYILPSYGNEIFSRNIGGLKLFRNQQNYFRQYFLALGGQWEYMPAENDLKILREFFKKYYGEEYAKIFDDAVTKNKKYLK